MKVKGWVVVNKITEEIKLTLITEPKKIVYHDEEWITNDYSAYEGRIEAGGYGSYLQYSFDTKLFKVKPCTITIHDKAVKK